MQHICSKSTKFRKSFGSESCLFISNIHEHCEEFHNAISVCFDKTCLALCTQEKRLNTRLQVSKDKHHSIWIDQGTLRKKSSIKTGRNFQNPYVCMCASMHTYSCIYSIFKNVFNGDKIWLSKC